MIKGKRQREIDGPEVTPLIGRNPELFPPDDELEESEPTNPVAVDITVSTEVITIVSPGAVVVVVIVSTDSKTTVTGVGEGVGVIVSVTTVTQTEAAPPNILPLVHCVCQLDVCVSTVIVGDGGVVGVTGSGSKMRVVEPPGGTTVMGQLIPPVPSVKVTTSGMGIVALVVELGGGAAKVIVLVGAFEYAVPSPAPIQGDLERGLDG